jgi:hypothetical protein
LAEWVVRTLEDSGKALDGADPPDLEALHQARLAHRKAVDR